MDVGREHLLNYQSWDSWIADWLHSESAANKVEKVERKVRPSQPSEPVDKSECTSHSTLPRTTSGAFSSRRRRWRTRSASSSSSSASSGNALTDTLGPTNDEKVPKKQIRGDSSADVSTKSTKPKVKKNTDPPTTTEKNRRPNSKIKHPPSSLNFSEQRHSPATSSATKRVRPSGDVRPKAQQNVSTLPYSILKSTRKLPKKPDQTSDSIGVTRKREVSRTKRTGSSLGVRTRPRSRTAKRPTTHSGRDSQSPDPEGRSVVPRPKMRLLHEVDRQAKLAPKGSALTPPATDVPSKEQAKKSATQKKPSYPRSQVPSETGTRAMNRQIPDTWDELKRLKEAQESRSYSVLQKISDELEAFRRCPLKSKLDNASNAMEEKIFQKNAHPANLAWEKRAQRKPSLSRTQSRCESKRRVRRLEEEQERVERHKEFMRKAGIKIKRADRARDCNLNPWMNGNNYTSSTDSGPFLRLSELRSASESEDDEGKGLPTFAGPAIQEGLTSTLSTLSAMMDAPTSTTDGQVLPKSATAAGEPKETEDLTLKLPPSAMSTTTGTSSPRSKSPTSESASSSKKVNHKSKSESKPKSGEKVTGAGEISGSKKKSKDKSKKEKANGKKGKEKKPKKGKKEGGKKKKAADKKKGKVAGKKAKKAATTKNQSNTNGLDERCSSFSTTSTEQPNDQTLKTVPDLELFMVESEEEEADAGNPFSSSSFSSPFSQRSISFDSETLNILDTALSRRRRSALSAIRKHPQKVLSWQPKNASHLKKTSNAGVGGSTRQQTMPRKPVVGRSSASSSSPRKFGERASTVTSGSRGRINAAALDHSQGPGMSRPRIKAASFITGAGQIDKQAAVTVPRQTNNASAETVRMLQELQLTHLNKILADCGLDGGKSGDHGCLSANRFWSSCNNAVDGQRGEDEQEERKEMEEEERAQRQTESERVTTPVGEHTTTFNRFQDDNNSSGGEDDDDDNDAAEEEEEGWEEEEDEEESNEDFESTFEDSDTGFDFFGEGKELQMYVTITSSEIDDIAMPFRASNAMHRALSEAYKMYVENRDRRRAFFTLGGERRRKSSSLISPWPKRATKPSIEPTVNVLKLVQRFFRKSITRRKRRPPAQWSQNNQTDGSLHGRFPRRVVKQTYRPLRLSSGHPLRRVLQYLSSQYDRRIFAIENQIDGRMLLDEDRVYFVHGLPCLLLRMLAPSFEDIRRGVTLMEEMMPRLFARLLVADRLPIMYLREESTRAPTKNNFTKCGWYQNRFKESAFVSSMHYFGMTESGFRVNQAHWDCPGRRCKDVELFAQGDPTFATDLCLIQSRNLLSTKGEHFILS
uniref:Uncharacterized protein n=1 Tax=Schistocephalus solidus TaxID=70667 RepID=A0A0X3PLT5_SCHSO